MKISVLTPDLSDNCLGRVYLSDTILQRHSHQDLGICKKSKKLFSDNDRVK